MYKDTSTTRKTKQNKPSKGRRRRLRLLFFVMVLFMGWAILTLWDQYDTAASKAAKLAELEAKLADVKERNEELNLQLIRLEDPEYIEQLLRKELHMTKEGETLFIETK